MNNTGAEDLIGLKVDVLVYAGRGRRNTLDDVTLVAVGETGALIVTDHGRRAFIPWASIEGILQAAGNEESEVPVNDLGALWGKGE